MLRVRLQANLAHGLPDEPVYFHMMWGGSVAGGCSQPARTHAPARMCVPRRDWQRAPSHICAHTPPVLAAAFLSYPLISACYQWFWRRRSKEEVGRFLSLRSFLTQVHAAVGRPAPASHARLAWRVPPGRAAWPCAARCTHGGARTRAQHSTAQHTHTHTHSTAQHTPALHPLCAECAPLAGWCAPPLQHLDDLDDIREALNSMHAPDGVRTRARGARGARTRTYTCTRPSHFSH